MKKKVLILGSTGSIGTSTLDVIANDPGSFDVRGLACASNIDLLNAQIDRFKPADVCLFNGELKDAVIPQSARLYTGIEGMKEMILRDADIVVNALPGSIGLEPTIEALNCGKTVALANKESLVMGGRLIRNIIARTDAELIPVDSEHSAIYQLLKGMDLGEVKSIIITASGGPFRKHTRKALESVELSDAMNHPTWKMGRKITLDSATLMNKGLEIIEARWLFDLEPSRIRTLVHPESIIHGIVELSDNSFFAYMANPDMKIPIAYALYGAKRSALPFSPLALDSLLKLTFHPPDLRRFPSIRLAYEALEAGDGALIAFNVSNEIAVQAFIDGRIKFTDIPRIVAETLAENPGEPVVDNLDAIRGIIVWTQNVAMTKITGTGRKKL
ncbi:MAG: 1-deoxy-D-xylulose-5-phosphate reductoisomerase [Syntrophorhabdaceae bacterium]|nr:1-deoxy-D-xylulose-5-phosphate reductoisomerase [Syntrophorhabdaceae bacterium]MDD4197517.1 1-deoxy-D-xylulose-5-phosphate reductoisomerase [Syntrophorhabdaceae bacterium]HOC46363.1 1-deoxy-D-xylulose-5-phosphate reductoisomerase [Syntrophorhabdaceae bacterium]